MDLRGKAVRRPQRSLINHYRVMRNVIRIFDSYLVGKTGECFGGGVDVHFDDKNLFIPDAMIVCNQDIVKANGIYGTPDLVVEVLSPFTLRYDRGPKMQAYARAGVREYWIVTPSERSVEVYLNRCGTFELDEAYAVYSEAYLSNMNEEEKAAIKTQIKVSLYDDLLVNVADIFYRL